MYGVLHDHITVVVRAGVLIQSHLFLGSYANMHVYEKKMF